MCQMTKAFPNSVIFDAAPTLEALKKSAFIRFWDQDGSQYSYENSRGEEHLGTKREVYHRFQRFQTD
jgi:hypothetical protein